MWSKNNDKKYEFIENKNNNFNNSTHKSKEI